MRRRRVPVILQLSGVECGATCLAMVLSYHGRKTTVAECRDICYPGRDGLTAATIVKAARHFGLRVNSYSLESSNISSLPLPAIVHWEFNHFVVVESWSPRKVVIVDPASGRRTITSEEFDAKFTGIVLVLEPGIHFQIRKKSSQNSWRRYLSTMFERNGAKSALAQVLLASLLLQMFGLVVPLLTKLLIDQVLPYRITSVMTVLGVGCLFVVFGQAVLSYLRSILLIYLRGLLDSHLMLNFFEHLLSLPFQFFQQRSSGDLLMRLNSNSLLRDTLTHQTLSVLLDGSFVLIYLGILTRVAPTFAGIATGLALLQILIVIGTSRLMSNLIEREIAAKSVEQGYLVEAIAGVSLLKASGTEDRAFGKWSSHFFNQLNLSLERGHISALVDTSLGVLRVLSPLLLLWVGALSVLDGSMSLGMMLAVNAIAISFLTPITTLVTSGQQLLLAGAHLDRITDVLDAQPEQPPNAGVLVRRLTGRVESRNVNFRYTPNSPEVLRDISFMVEPGQKVAVVGPTGSGKSTLAMILLGLQDVTQGDIFYDGVPLSKLNRRSLRSHCGVVLQHTSLMSGSIRQNITLNSPDISLNEVIEAAKLAGLHEEIVRMPMGYETPISEGGTSLSGGQRQRLAIARALAHQPSVLILDEATSHLDVHTEAVVDQNLSRLSCTRIVIAHRLSTVRNADQILVLEQGAIIERGSHEELMSMNGHYAALVRNQQVDEAATKQASHNNMLPEEIFRQLFVSRKVN